MPHRRSRAPRVSRSATAALTAAVAAALLTGFLAACDSSTRPSPSATAAATPIATASATAAPPTAPASPAATAPTTAPGAPTAAPTAAADDVAVLRGIADDIAGIRDLGWKTAVTPRVIDEAELRRLLQRDFETSGTSGDLAEVEALYRGLGAMTGDRSLEDLYLEALGSQVLGFYRDDDRTLYIVRRSGGLGPVEKYTAAHELTHALQDQHFGLASLGLDTPGQSDRALAALSLVEGDASLAGVYWSQGHLSLADLGEILRAAAAPGAQEALDALPPIVREGLTFPYLQGLQFVMGLQTTGGWEAVDAAYARPPASTEQILHPEKYQAGEGPVKVGTPLPRGVAGAIGPDWRLTYTDTLGELGLRTWLAQANDAQAADAAAAGWGGDRVELYRGPAGGWAIVMRTAWDDAAAAGRFTEAARLVVGALPHATLMTGAQGPVILVGSDAAVLGKLEAAAAR